MESLEEHESTSSNLIIKLKKKPKTLLATILIANNFINIGIVIVSDYFIKLIIGPQQLLSWGESVVNKLGLISFSPFQLGNFINFLISLSLISYKFAQHSSPLSVDNFYLIN